jgi:hypothetical protein
MTWRLNPDAICEAEGCMRARAFGSDLCLACQQGIGMGHRRIAERDESPVPPVPPVPATAATIDLENWPVLPED